MLRGFVFPEVLPPSMESLRYRNGLEANTQLFEAFIVQLRKKFLESKPPFLQRFIQNELLRRMLPFLLALVILLVAVIAGKVIWDNVNAKYPRTKAEKNLTSEVLYCVMSNMTNLEMIGEVVDDALQASNNYLSSANPSYSRFVEKIDLSINMLEQIDLTSGDVSDEFAARISDSPFDAAEIKAMHDLVGIALDGYLKNIDFIKEIFEPNYLVPDENKLEILSLYQEYLDADLESWAYACNEMLLPITNGDAMEEFRDVLLPGLKYIPLKATDWKTDAKMLETAQNQCHERQEDVINDIAAQVGENAWEMYREREKLIQIYIEEGYTREQAEELLEMVEQINRDCMPVPGDDTDTLWIKMNHQLNLAYFEDARACMEAYWELTKDDPNAQQYVPAVNRLIDYCEQNVTILYGMVVMGYYEPDGINEVLEIGDLIIGFNGEACESTETYGSMKETADNVFTLDIIRADETGSLKLVKVEMTKDMPRVFLADLTYVE